MFLANDKDFEDNKVTFIHSNVTYAISYFPNHIMTGYCGQMAIGSSHCAAKLAIWLYKKKKLYQQMLLHTLIKIIKSFQHLVPDNIISLCCFYRYAN